MIPAPIPENEKSRLAELRRLALLDSERERRFDRLTQIAARVFDMPIVLISLVDENRQWIKSCVGTDMQETDRSISFCGHTLIEGKELGGRPAFLTTHAKIVAVIFPRAGRIFSVMPTPNCRTFPRLFIGLCIQLLHRNASRN